MNKDPFFYAVYSKKLKEYLNSQNYLLKILLIKNSQNYGVDSLEEYHKWNSLRYQSDREDNVPMPHKNLGHLLLWNLYYGDNYNFVVPDTSYQKHITEFVVFDGICLK